MRREALMAIPEFGKLAVGHSLQDDLKVESSSDAVKTSLTWP